MPKRDVMRENGDGGELVLRACDLFSSEGRGNADIDWEYDNASILRPPLDRPSPKMRVSSPINTAVGLLCAPSRSHHCHLRGNRFSIRVCLLNERTSDTKYLQKQFFMHRAYHYIIIQFALGLHNILFIWSPKYASIIRGKILPKN